MKIKIISFGKSKGSSYGDLITDYAKRLKEVQIVELSHANGDKKEVMQRESKIIEKELSDKSFKVFLDGRGRSFSSVEFSKKLDGWRERSSNIEFIIGGAFGFTEEILKRADFTLSLSGMTMPHMLARVMLLEQLYRAKAIREGHPYHK